MEVINIELLSALLARNQNYAELAACLKHMNESCQIGLKYMKQEAILAMARRINTREQAGRAAELRETPEEQCINWSFGQFKVFLWVLLYQCLYHKIQLANIEQHAASQIQRIFPLKSEQFIRYEIRLLNSSKKTHPAEWSKEETTILKEFMASYLRDGRCSDGVNWRWVSFRIFTQSGCQFFRNLNHCREKWNNHLNPSVKRSHWTPQEDVRLFELIEQYGLKWSRISKLMEDTRTEHMVKNRYNRFMRIWKISKGSGAISKSMLMQKIREYYDLESNMSQEESCPAVKVEENSAEQPSSHPIKRSEGEQEENVEMRCKEEPVVKEEAVWGQQERSGPGPKLSSQYFHPYYISHQPALTPPQIFPFMQ